MMTLPELYERRFWRSISRLEKEHEMKLLNPLEQLIVNDSIKKSEERGLKQGLKNGMKEGLKQGREQGLEQGLEQGIALGRTEGAAALFEAESLKQVFGATQ